MLPHGPFLSFAACSSRAAGCGRPSTRLIHSTLFVSTQSGKNRSCCKRRAAPRGLKPPLFLVQASGNTVAQNSVATLPQPVVQKRLHARTRLRWPLLPPTNHQAHFYAARRGGTNRTLQRTHLGHSDTLAVDDEDLPCCRATSHRPRPAT